MNNPAYFGEFGGMFVPELLVPALKQLENEFNKSQTDAAFQSEFEQLLNEYAGRPTPLTLTRNLIKNPKVKLYLKREDLLHGGAHKTNQVLGQALLTKRMGKKEVIAETGAGQRGVATALACALLGLKCRIYMGAKDVERQQPNVFRMKLMGATVIPVTAGSGTLKDAVNEALRDWSANYKEAHYLLGTAAGPHPFPTMVREFQKMIGEEAKQQVLKAEGRLPDAVLACVGGGSITPLVCLLILLTSQVLSSLVLSLLAKVLIPMSMAQPSVRAQKVSYTVLILTLCKMMMAKSKSLIQFQPVLIIQRSVHNMPFCMKRVAHNMSVSPIPKH